MNENMSLQQWLDNYEENKSKRRKLAVKRAVLIICCIAGFIFFVHYGMNLGTFRGSSFKTFRKRARGNFYLYELPDGAEDFKFICHNYGLGANFTAAFTLHGAEYDEWVGAVKTEKHGKVVGNHDELDFTGMKVSETADHYDDDGRYIGFPASSIKYVIDDDINDYTILYYDAYEGAGAKTKAIAANTATGRIVIYSYGSN